MCALVGQIKDLTESLHFFPHNAFRVFALILTSVNISIHSMTRLILTVNIVTVFSHTELDFYVISLAVYSTTL